MVGIKRIVTASNPPPGIESKEPLASERLAADVESVLATIAVPSPTFFAYSESVEGIPTGELTNRNAGVPDGSASIAALTGVVAAASTYSWMLPSPAALAV
jgi:hypothetical protein